jgi:hypothetical protein
MASSGRGRACALRRVVPRALAVLETDNLFDIQQLGWYTIRIIAETAGGDPDLEHGAADGRHRSAG